MMWISFEGSFVDFCREGKNDAGTLIEVILSNKKKQLLIGDVSMYGSVMDADPLLNASTRVVRYKRLWSR